MYGHNRGVLGDPGTCKTLWLTYNAYQYHLAGTPIISNFRLEFPHTFIPFKDLPNAIRVTVCGCAVNPDDPEIPCEHGNRSIVWQSALFYAEMGRGADSYKFLSQRNNEISDLIFQIRKFGAVIWYDAQRYGTVTTRVRDLTDFFFLMEPVTVDIASITPDMIGDALDKPIQRLMDGRLIIKGVADVTVTDGEMRPMSDFRFDGRPYYHLYNTRELVRV